MAGELLELVVDGIVTNAGTGTTEEINKLSIQLNRSGEMLGFFGSFLLWAVFQVVLLQLLRGESKFIALLIFLVASISSWLYLARFVLAQLLKIRRLRRLPELAKAIKKA